MTTRIKSYVGRVTKDLASLSFIATDDETRAIIFACKHDIKPSTIEAAILDGRGVDVQRSTDVNSEDFNRCKEYLRCAKLPVEELIAECFSNNP